jgi:hypothetical protein
MTELDDILSAQEAADVAGKSLDAVRKAMQRGSLRGRNIGRQWVTTRDEVARWQAWRPYRRRHVETGRYQPGP